MSTMALVEGPSGVVAAWETDGQIYLASLKPGTDSFTKPQAAPGTGRERKHPALAGNGRGETILVWTEGMGWNRGGGVAWQVFDRDGKPTAEQGTASGVPTWSLVTVFTRSDGGFTILY